MSWLGKVFGAKNDKSDDCPTIMQAVSVEREAYLRALRSLLHEIREEHGEVFSEIGFEPDNEDIDTRFRRMRIDAAFVEDGKVAFILANLDVPTLFEAKVESWKGLEVELRPLVWNEVKFEVSGGPPNEAAIAAWRSYWMDDEEKRFDKTKELQGVVHSVTQPTQTSNGWSITVDFGSADIDAFSALLELFKGNGAARIAIGSAK